MKQHLGKLFLCECLKLIQSNIFRITVLTLLLLNLLILIIVNKTDGFPASSYCQLKIDCEKKSEQGKLEYIKEEYVKRKVLLQYETEQLEEQTGEEHETMSKEIAKEEGYSDAWYEKVLSDYSEGNVLIYQDNLQSEYAFLSKVYEEASEIMNYPDYLQKVQKEATNDLSVSIFQSSLSSFSKQNIKKTAKDFKKIEETSVQFTGTLGFSNILGKFIYDLSPILTIAIVCILLFMEDKKNGCIQLWKSTWNGRGSFVISKILVLLLISILLSFVFWGSDFLYVWTTYGSINLSASIQSMSGFTHCTITESIGVYLLLFLIEKGLMFFLTALFFSFFAILASNHGIFLLESSVLFLLSFVCYQFISRFSFFSMLHYLNILYFLNTVPLTRDYLNFNILGHPVSHSFICWIIFGIIIILLFIANILIYSHGTSKYNQIYFEVATSHWKKKKKANVSVFRQEFFKLFIGSKAAILLVILAFFMWYLMNHQQTYLNQTDQSYQFYMKKLEGPVTQEKREYIKNEAERIQTVEKQIQSIIDFYDAGKISENEKNNNMSLLNAQIETKSGFILVQERLSYIDAHPDKSLSFVYEKGWNVLFGLSDDNYEKDKKNALICVISIIACLAGLTTLEYENGMYQLQKVYPKGKGITYGWKFFVAAIVIIMIMGFVYIPDFIYANQTYGLHHVMALAESIPALEHALGAGESLLFYTVILFSIRFITYMAIVLVLTGISRITKNTVKTIMFATILFAVPLILSLLGVHFIDQISMNLFLSANQFLQNGLLLNT